MSADSTGLFPSSASDCLHDALHQKERPIVPALSDYRSQENGTVSGKPEPERQTIVPIPKASVKVGDIVTCSARTPPGYWGGGFVWGSLYSGKQVHG